MADTEPVTSQPKSTTVNVDVPNLDWQKMFKGDWQVGCMDCLNDPVMCKLFWEGEVQFNKPFLTQSKTYLTIIYYVVVYFFNFRCFWLLLPMFIGLEKC